MKGVAGRCLVTMGGRGWGEERCVVWEGEGFGEKGRRA